MISNNKSLKTGFVVHILFLASLVSCNFQRGPRYWSGKPQSVGIDFSSSHVTAIYANRANNFTTLAIVFPPPGNEYKKYVYALFAAQRDWDDGQVIINDDEDSLSGFWSQQGLTQAVDWVRDFNSRSCRHLSPLLGRFKLFQKACLFQCDHEDCAPQPPKSKYTHLLRQSRVNHLRELMPKWYRSPQSQAKTKSKFIMYIYELLSQVQQIALSEHGVHIMSASISRPSWMNNDYSDIFDEVCLLAGIETWEQPHNRVDIATKGLKAKGQVMVLDYGQYFLNVHRSVWDEHDKEHRQRSSMFLDQYGTTWVLVQLLDRVVSLYNRNGTEIRIGNDAAFRPMLEQIMDARLQIKYRRDWDENIDFENRTLALNVTDSMGFMRVLQMTGGDILEVEGRYLEDVSKSIWATTWKYTELYQYQKGLPNWNETKELPWGEQSSIWANTVQHVPGDWLEPIEAFIILDTGYDAALLQEAVQKALGWNETMGNGGGDGGVCVPNIEIAARGAALRALDWVGYWEPWERDRRRWDSFDENDPSTWGGEEEWEKHRADEDHNDEQDDL